MQEQRTVTVEIALPPGYEHLDPDTFRALVYNALGFRLVCRNTFAAQDAHDVRDDA